MTNQLEPTFEAEGARAIFRRALAAQDDRLTADELRAAAREIELDEAEIDRWIELYDRAQRAAIVAAEPPVGSGITVEIDQGSLVLHAPPAVPIGRITLPLAFLGTFASSLFGGGFPGFTRWAVGAMLVLSAAQLISSAVVRRTLRLGPKEGTLERRAGPFARVSPLDVDMLAVRMVPEHWVPGRRHPRRVAPHLLIEHGGQRFTILEDATTPELEWVERLLRAWIGAPAR